MIETLYWFGNSAKVRIIRDILRTNPNAHVFDYGAGRGGDWDKILAANPGLKLTCYEPDDASFADLEKKLSGKAALYTGGSIDTLAINADYIVSFSVFEHVADRTAYLRHAKRCLAANGEFHLNYEDGHFRQFLNLSAALTWPGALVEHTRNLLAPLWLKLGKYGLYQKRVTPAAMTLLLQETGLTIASERYENLASLKTLAKTIAPEQKAAFATFWIEAEDALNSRFKTSTSPMNGDSTNLWREMPSRTLCLKHA